MNFNLSMIHFEKAERDIVCRENIRLGANILAE